MNKKKVILNWIKNYANDEFGNSFMKDYLDPVQIESAQNIESDINDFQLDIKDTEATIDGADPSDQYQLAMIDQTKGFIELEKHCLDDADHNDLFITKYNTGDKPMMCKIMTDKDLPKLAQKFCELLISHTSIPFKITWLLKHKRESDAQFAKKAGLYQQQVNYYKNGKRDIMNMTLNSALKIVRYYDTHIRNTFDRIIVHLNSVIDKHQAHEMKIAKNSKTKF